MIRLFTWILAAISAPNPDVNGASWAISKRPVFFTDCKSVIESDKIVNDSSNKTRLEKFLVEIAIFPPITNNNNKLHKFLFSLFFSIKRFHFRVAPDWHLTDCVSVSAAVDRN